MTTSILKPREYWSFWTHFIGAIASAAAAILLPFFHRDSSQWSFFVFGLSLVALYACSSVYHYSNGSKACVYHLRKLDHSMIYVLIAGTYTPILVNCMEGTKSLDWLLAIWGAAAAGIIVKLCWFSAPRWLYTSFYLILGWAVVFQARDLTVSGIFIIWLAAGGVLYSAGAVMYIIKKPNIFATFGFHEVFHIFIMLGSICHFIAINFYI